MIGGRVRIGARPVGGSEVRVRVAADAVPLEASP
jgi:hypothetical protein